MPIPTDTGIVILPPRRFSFDKVVIVSTSSKSRLEQGLPLAELNRVCSDFEVRSNGCPYRYRSNIQFTYRPEPSFWDLLLAHEAKLGDYRFNRLELAFDFPCDDEASARETAKFLALHFRKPWHKSGNIKLRYDPTKPPRAGIIQGPTWYFEETPASTALKFYARHPKYGPTPDQPVARLEWTLEPASNIRDKTGIETISDLLSFTPTEFFKRWFRLERVDYEALGRWLTRLDRKRPSPNYSARSAVGVVASVLTNSEIGRRGQLDETLDELWQLTYEKNMSPAALRGLLRARRREGRGRYRDLSDYKIEKFFRTLEVKFSDE